MTDRTDRIIDAARRSFNQELMSADYPLIHGDDDQVGRLIGFLDPKPGCAYLDLATGNGAVAFALAERCGDAHVVGVDIADQAIERNKVMAAKKGYGNLEFRLANGREIDFPAASFDGIACRYAFHHFPNVDGVLADARRVLRPQGGLVIADALKHPKDDQDFINRFQALKPDGHVRMYEAEDLVTLLRRHGFEAQARFASAITFSRNLTAAYRSLLERTKPEILKLYQVEVEGDRAELTFEIQCFRFVLYGE